MGGRYRRVAANEDGLMVWGKSGKSQFFPFEKLDHVLDGERIFVAMFADQGVTIPGTPLSAAMPSSSVPSSRRASTKLRIETKRKREAEKAAAEAKQGRPAPGDQGQATQAEAQEEAVGQPTPKTPRPRHSGPGRLDRARVPPMDPFCLALELLHFKP